MDQTAESHQPVPIVGKRHGAVRVRWSVVVVRRAQTDAQKLAAGGLKAKALEMPSVIRENPFQNPPGGRAGASRGGEALRRQAPVGRTRR